MGSIFPSNWGYMNGKTTNLQNWTLVFKTGNKEREKWFKTIKDKPLFWFMTIKYQVESTVATNNVVNLKVCLIEHIMISVYNNGRIWRTDDPRTTKITLSLVWRYCDLPNRWHTSKSRSSERNIEASSEKVKKLEETARHISLLCNRKNI